jgi:hypothetical protein
MKIIKIEAKEWSALAAHAILNILYYVHAFASISRSDSILCAAAEFTTLLRNLLHDLLMAFLAQDIFNQSLFQEAFMKSTTTESHSLP